jgi:alkylated DNA nucleotide flippase Atl1
VPEFVAAVRELVRRIPRGRVLTYGDVARLLGQGGPRAVGGVLRHHGDGLPWWRVVRADGTPNPTRPGESQARLVEDGTPMSADGRRVDLDGARWSPPPSTPRRQPRAEQDPGGGVRRS